MYKYFRKNLCLIEFQMALMAIDGKNYSWEAISFWIALYKLQGNRKHCFNRNDRHCTRIFTRWWKNKWSHFSWFIERGTWQFSLEFLVLHLYDIGSSKICYLYPVAMINLPYPSTWWRDTHSKIWVMTNKLLIIDYHKGMNYWDVFRYPFWLQPDKVKATVLATIALHTWLKSESDTGKVYIAHGVTG